MSGAVLGRVVMNGGPQERSMHTLCTHAGTGINSLSVVVYGRRERVG